MKTVYHVLDLRGAAKTIAYLALLPFFRQSGPILTKRGGRIELHIPHDAARPKRELETGTLNGYRRVFETIVLTARRPAVSLPRFPSRHDPAIAARKASSLLNISGYFRRGWP